MRRLLPTLVVLFVALAGAAAATGASGPVFTVVPATPAMAPLASAETPNSSGGIILPPAYLTRRESAGLPFSTLQALWQNA